MVVVEVYADFFKFMRHNFPHFGTHNNSFIYVTKADCDKCMSIETGSLYFHLSGEIPDWFKFRFTKIAMMSKPGKGRFLSLSENNNQTK